jgi:hypothetical protein
MNQPRIFGAQSFWIDPALLQGSQRGLVGDENVRSREQSLQNFRSSRLVVVQRDRPLVAIRREVIGGFGADKGRTPAPRLIARLGPLYLNDIGAEVT